MRTFIPAKHAAEVTRKHTGVVIPVYLPVTVDRKTGEHLLRDTVSALIDHISDPTAVCLSVDGHECGEDIAQKIAKEFGTRISQAPENKGKLNAIIHGMRDLLAGSDHQYLAVIDQDGDHFGNELANLVRVAEHIASFADSDRVMVLGQRRSRHRPMGLLRGEMEELADRVLLDALQYHASVTGRPMRLEYALLMDEFPDFHSGFKVFDRTTAKSIFLSDPEMAGANETCYYRHSVESVLTVEALESGAYLGTATRSTLNEQPITTFGLFNRIQLVADKMIWPCLRLEVQPHFVRQWLSNHIPRLLLSTLAPDGARELEEIRRAVMAGVGVPLGEDEPDLMQPMFV